jgi:hypothetical protein
VPLFRRGPAKADLAALAVPSDARVLAWSRTAQGDLLAATRFGLHLPGPVTVPWHEVIKATWKDGELRVQAADGVRRFELAEPGRLPEVVRERVTASIVISEKHQLPGGGGVRIVARRRAGGGPLLWAAHFDAGLDPDDPGLRAQADELIDAARERLGG